MGFRKNDAFATDISEKDFRFVKVGRVLYPNGTALFAAQAPSYRFVLRAEVNTE
jgi:hypothetical protein